MDSDQGKLFIGGISWETTEDKLRDYFGSYGEVLQAVIMKDKLTARPRGFGFIVFADPAVLDRVLQDRHTIDDRMVEAKRALSREEQQTAKAMNPIVGRSSGSSGGNFRTKKIFVGGLPPTLTEEGFRQYFENYGNVTDVVIMYDQSTQRPRGFGFISFDSEDAVDHVLQKTFHDIIGKVVEVKRALPREANQMSGGGSYHTNTGSTVNTSNYDGRVDSNRYMQAQAAGGGYPTYGTPGYGYGTNNGIGYGGYNFGGYNGSNPGYGGPAGAYGNPNVPSTGYTSAPPGAVRSPWSNQAPSAYGSGSYGSNPAYGASATWNSPAAATGQSPNASTGYGNQSYEYGGYGGVEGSFGSQGGYGAIGGRGGSASNPAAEQGELGAGSGYMGGGYGDGRGNSGYPDAWRSDPSQVGGYGTSQGSGPPGGSASYGGGFSGAQTRQT
ncbi:heterogeneous nuclear ribonucleoprotein 1-like [Typha angustifolia]|uniref:heterogeneous nuclear ribonucleoprotein 1-like n=1 Tax=Typha angustifolia TaxID=59011 RepID=UPI003C2D83AA